jgi:hypothetical protein
MDMQSWHSHYAYNLRKEDITKPSQFHAHCQENNVNFNGCCGTETRSVKSLYHNVRKDCLAIMSYRNFSLSWKCLLVYSVLML